MKSPVILTLAGLAGVVLLLWLIPGGLELTFTPRGESRPVLVLPLEPGERFTLHYYHSVEDAPIWEEHSVDGEGRIFIEEERYLKFGAGLGRIPGRGRLERRGPYEVIADMHHPLPGGFVLRVGAPGVDHTIIQRGLRFNLSPGLAGRAVHVSARPVNLFQRLARAWKADIGSITPMIQPTTDPLPIRTQGRQ